MAKERVDDEPEIVIEDAPPEEFVDVDVTKGVQFDPISKRRQEKIERMMSCPTTLFDVPVPRDFWKLVKERIEKDIRKTRDTEADLRTSRMVARAYARALSKGSDRMTPIRASEDLHDMMRLASPNAESDPETMRCFNQACYVCFNNEYMGRQVG